MILILTGLPASGKSTYAHEWVAEDPTQRLRVNYDDLRLEMFGENWKFNRQEEAQMKQRALCLAREALLHQKSVVIDNTNLTIGARKPWEDLGKELGIKVEDYELDTPVAECVARDKLREGRARVGRAVIERMALTTGWIDWNDSRYWNRKFVIVDVDGTLANGDHRQHYIRGEEIIHKMDCTERDLTVGQKCGQCGRAPAKRWDKFHAEVHKDTPIEPIIELVRLLHYHYNIIVVSGRWLDQGCGLATEDWLNKYLSIGSCECREHRDKPSEPICIYKHLFMRGGGDSRPDYEVKSEILDLLPKERIAFVLDDRDQVVKMWRQNGLTCLQVAEEAF